MRRDPASCGAGTAIDAPLWNADNARETVVTPNVPRRRAIDRGFTGAADVVRRVVLEGGGGPFRDDPDTRRLSSPAPPAPPAPSVYVQRP